ncbi:MAG: tRNA 2-thiouridine(34) synthase MnmA [Candidatus Vogelbacteria bacterium]|nr:tRNA 2-thiouridine(34) synthase MnmA [Candidatus Vogelbacteria bacterium]
MYKGLPPTTYPLQPRSKIFVGLSGGVDSAVSAALLKGHGYDVTGVFIKVWSPEWLSCPWPDERRDAMRVAAHLQIPFITLDCTDEYKKSVVDYMISEYSAGKVPNPDVMCNKHVKFDAFLHKAIEMGADYIATGHYAQNINGKLLAGIDKNKDQTYFLWTLTQEQLSKTLFPIGHLTKPEVRELAHKFRLPVADKKDSQGVCFLGMVDMKEFLSHYIELKQGKVLDESGKVIGTHDGALLYTIGERKGFRINEKTSDDEPYYIVSKNLTSNQITVSHKECSTSDVEQKAINLRDVNWILGETPVFFRTYRARTRYRQPLQECKLEIIDKIAAKIIFREAQTAITSGQSLVLYNGNECLGGGIIQ